MIKTESGTKMRIEIWDTAGQGTGIFSLAVFGQLSSSPPVPRCLRQIDLIRLHLTIPSFIRALPCLGTALLPLS